MNAIILGDGGFGQAIARTLEETGEPRPTVLGRPTDGHHDPRTLGQAEVIFDASRGDQVPGNVAAALAAGCRRLVIGTTAWDEARPAVETALLDHAASAVAASNFSLGVALFGRLIDRAVELFGAVDAFDPYLVEWHRSSKADRPSGTARDLSRRILAAHPTKARLADPGREGPRQRDELEVAVVRAGAAPGMHLVGFDAPGETVELRLTARDRTAYAQGALAAARWLLREPRRPGFHSFDVVVDDLLARPSERPLAMAG
jgi:4-hydroxy-tetrahydrodipicolinate reductase